MGETEICQCKSGEFCWPSTGSRPDICAASARVSYCVNSPFGGDVFRINDLARVAKELQKATVLKYVSSSRPRESIGFDGKAKYALCHRRGKLQEKFH